MTSAPAQAESFADRLGRVRRKSLLGRHVVEGLVQTSLVLCASFSIFVTTAILAVLAGQTWRFFSTEMTDAQGNVSTVSPVQFIFGLEWNPLLGAEKHFGIWPLICGTLLVTTVAMLVAIPFGLITAIYLSEYAPPRLRAAIKPVLEVLAGVPTVVYGFFALTVVTPALQKIYGGFEAYNAASAGIAVGIMCLPIVTSIAEDAMRAVPNSLREAAHGLGGTKFDVSVRIVFPAAISGVVAASLLAIARAVGETMIVALAAGNLAKLTLNPADQVQTMTAYMVQIFFGDVTNLGVEYYSSYAVAATLFIITLLFTLGGHFIRNRLREEYE